MGEIWNRQKVMNEIIPPRVCLIVHWQLGHIKQDEGSISQLQPPPPPPQWPDAMPHTAPHFTPPAHTLGTSGQLSLPHPEYLSKLQQSPHPGSCCSFCQTRFVLKILFSICTVQIYMRLCLLHLLLARDDRLICFVPSLYRGLTLNTGHRACSLPTNKV